MVRLAPKRQSLIHMSEDCTGDILDRCNQVYDCYEMVSSKDCRYCVINVELKDCFDTYESAFGCVSLRRKHFCVLNKQYSKEEYKELLPKLIQLMTSHKEWGEFFPAKYSPFTYEESTAQEYFQIKEKTTESIPKSKVELPDSLQDTSDDITKKLFYCEKSGKHYKITPHELALHRKLGVALPRRAPLQRYFDRLAMRPKYELHRRACSQCSKDIWTTFSKDEPAPVYCHDCYIGAFH